jgi:beta-phosphoglucomutase-like phosphatase (HAD superfamily)
MRPGLPDGVRARLFDLEGVPTETASVPAAAWKEISDSFLPRRAGGHRRPFDHRADRVVRDLFEFFDQAAAS